MLSGAHRNVLRWQKIARQMLVPGGAVLLGLAIALRLGLSDLVSVQALDVALTAIGVVVVVLAWRFQTPRIALATVVLGVAAYAAAAALELESPKQDCILALLAFAVPVNLAVLLLIDEGGFDLESLGWWAGLVAVEAVIVYVLAASAAAVTAEWLSTPLMGANGWAAGLVRPASMAAITAAIALAVNCARNRKSSEVSLFWASVAASLAMASAAPSRAAYFATAVVLLGLGVLETSYSVAFNDELTGLPGRRAYKRMIASLDGEYSVAIVDIDHFKKFNDTYGHDIGDQVLRMVAWKLSEVTGGGKAYRCGGEEFAVVFPYLDADAAFDHLELLRQEIESSPFTVRGPDRSRRKRPERRNMFDPKRVQPKPLSASVTVSIGLAEPSGSATVEEVVKWADKALYEAKGLGRNRVVRYSGRKRARRKDEVDAPTPTTPFR